MTRPRSLPAWTTVVPVVGAVVGVLLIGCVLSAVHHAEVVAHRIGEPFGSLVLAVAVTVIEVALIVTLMVSGDPGETSALARDTVFAAIMISCNGIIGISVFAGALRSKTKTADFNAEGTATALPIGAPLSAVGVVIALLVLLPEGAGRHPQRATQRRADELQPR